jgi:hypothetical protein
MVDKVENEDKVGKVDKVEKAGNLGKVDKMYAS